MTGIRAVRSPFTSRAVFGAHAQCGQTSVPVIVNVGCCPVGHPAHEKVVQSGVLVVVVGFVVLVGFVVV